MAMNDTNIIIAALGGGRTTVTASRFMEDYGQVLKITGVELPDVYQVDFANSPHDGNSVTMVGNADGVLIPRQFFDTGRDVYAFLYLTREDAGRTMATIRIPNKRRPYRTNEEPTPEEQSVIDQTIAALNSAVEKTAQDVIDSDANADRAEEAAQLASDKADEANAHADRAEASESTVLQYMNRAETAATNAENSADDARTSADNADHSANLAQQVAITNGYMEVRIVDGHLIYERTDSVDTDFFLNAVGHLIMESVAT